MRAGTIDIGIRVLEPARKGAGIVTAFPQTYRGIESDEGTSVIRRYQEIAPRIVKAGGGGDV